MGKKKKKTTVNKQKNEKSTERWDRQLNNVVMETMVDIRLRDKLDKTDTVKNKSVIN